jgi:hypothetical protein
VTVVFRLAYAAAVAILYILFVVFGIRTLYAEPDYPQYPGGGPVIPNRGQIYCEPGGGDCYKETYATDTDPIPQRILITDEVLATLPEDEREFVTELREYEDEVQEYNEDDEDYHRNIFIIAAFWGVLAIGAAVGLYRRVEAMPLGLLFGGIGALVYGWVEWADGPGEASTSVTFVIVTAGLILVLAGGYYFLNERNGRAKTGDSS